LESGLPDGIFSNQKIEFGKISEGLAMEGVGIFHGNYVGPFYGHLVYFVAICYTYFVAICSIFPRFGTLYQ
jgi:hypothetical protein